MVVNVRNQKRINCERFLFSFFLRATQIKTYSWDNAQVVLIGNKLDLEEDRQVPTESGQRLARELGQCTLVMFSMKTQDRKTI